MTFKTTVSSKGQPIAGALVGANDEITGQSFLRSTDGSGYADIAMIGVPVGHRCTLFVIKDGFVQHVDGDAYVTTAEDQILTIELTPSFKRASVLPTPPTRDAILAVGLTFQGLIFETAQFGRLPGFEACLPWLTLADRQAVYAAKRAAGDTHCIVTIPDGVPLYDEANQAYSPDKFGPLDWTHGNTAIDARLTDLIREVIGAGFSKILLYLGGDGGGDAYQIAYTQLDLLFANEDFRTTLYTYCVVVPGWDGVFYGWPLEQIEPWAAKFRALWPDGYLGLHYSTGHIPLGEGGSDFKPGGRMEHFDLLIGEYDDNPHQDSTWQILNRLEAHYVRPFDQPAGDDPTRVYYLSEPGPRGPWGHVAMEFGEYQAVRCGQDFAGMVRHVGENRAYLRSMGVAWVG